MGDMTGILWAAAIVIGFGLLAAMPVVFVNMVQNRRRRLYTTEISDRFGLQASLDESHRFSRALPIARGKYSGLFVDVRPGISRSGYLKTTGWGFFRTDLCLITVFASPQEEPLLLRSRLSTATDPELSPVTEQLLAEFRERHKETFEIAWRTDGRMESCTSPLLSRKTADAVADVLSIMIHIGNKGL